MSPDNGKGALEGAALERLNRIGGQEFLVEMIELFLEHAPQRLNAARAGLETGAMKDLYRAAHSLKSTAGNLGARSLQASAEHVEALALAGDTAEIPALLDEMDALYENVRGALVAERDRRKGNRT